MILNGKHLTIIWFGKICSLKRCYLHTHNTRVFPTSKNSTDFEKTNEVTFHCNFVILLISANSLRE